MQFNAIIENDEHGYFAYVPALKGCVSQGETLEETVKNIREAIELYVEDLELHELGNTISKNYIIAPIEVDIPNAG